MSPNKLELYPPEVEAWMFHVEACGDVLTYRATLAATFMLARDVIARGVPGDLVECGVYAGAQCAAMAKAIIAAGATGRKVHLFDSFAGLPAPGPEDHEVRGSGITEAGHLSYSLGGVRENMAAWGVPDELLVYHPGWFKNTMPGGVEKIALLRLDGDLYESTKTAMQHLYPLLSDTGWCICDDYNFSGVRKAIHEVTMPQPVYWLKGTKQ